MNRIKNKYPNSDIFVFSAVLLLTFWLICTKLIVKMDDGHFMGILANDDFSLREWLKLRYETVSGRTVAEATMMTFLNKSPLLWKLFGFALFEYIIYFIYKIALCFDKHNNSRKIATVSCCSVFLIFIGVLNAGAFWFAGSFTFLIPCTFMLITVTPALFDFLDLRYSRWQKAVAFFCSVLAASQEQSAVCTCALLICLFIFSAAKKKLNISSYLPVLPASAATFYLLASPGAANRGIQQAASSFEAFSDFGIAEKLLLGFSTYFSYTFFFSVFVTLLFSFLLSAVTYTLYKSDKKLSAFARLSPVCVALVSVFYNLLHFVINGKSVDSMLKEAFINNELNAWVYSTVGLCGAVILLWAFMLILILKKNNLTGLTVGLLCCAALGCGIMIGFSSSVYASGKRVFFFTEIFMVFACIILFSNLTPGKLSRLFFCIITASAVIFYMIDFINLLFLEIPIMN